MKPVIFFIYIGYDVIRHQLTQLEKNLTEFENINTNLRTPKQQSKKNPKSRAAHPFKYLKL